jgi:hypothetical protein
MSGRLDEFVRIALYEYCNNNGAGAAPAGPDDEAHQNETISLYFANENAKIPSVDEIIDAVKEIAIRYGYNYNSSNKDDINKALNKKIKDVSGKATGDGQNKEPAGRAPSDTTTPGGPSDSSPIVPLGVATCLCGIGSSKIFAVKPELSFSNPTLVLSAVAAVAFMAFVIYKLSPKINGAYEQAKQALEDFKCNKGEEQPTSLDP